MNRRDIIKSAVAAAAVARFAPVRALIGLPGGSAAPGNYLGVNALSSVNYFSNEFPFLDLSKLMQAGYATMIAGHPWATSKSGTNSTGEEPYLAVDSDGWPTSLTASPTPPGGQQFTYVQTQLMGGAALSGSSPPPPATSGFPTDTAVATIKGSGQFSLSNVLNLAVVSGGSYLSISGNTITSTLPANQTGSISFNYNCISGSITTLSILATTSGNYLKIGPIVQQQYLSLYNGGQVTHPLFIKAMTAGGAGLFKCLRVMGALQIYNQDFVLLFNANLAQGATSGTLSSIKSQGMTFTMWPFPSSVTKQVVFQTGQIVTMSGTTGSANVTWNTGLSAPVTTTTTNPGAMAVMPLQDSWSQRPLMSNATWAGIKGVPHEVCIQVANECGVDAWTNIPACTHVTDNTYTQNLAQLYFNGSGANVSGSNLSSQSGLTGKCYVEYSNETWNYGSGYMESYFCQMEGYIAGYGQALGNYVNGAQKWYGVTVGAISNTLASAWGSSFGSKCFPVFMGQAAATQWGQYGYIAVGANAAVSGTNHLKGTGFAPYAAVTAYTTGDMSSADAATIAALVDPPGELISLANTNTGASGNTYSSVPTAGWLGNCIANVSSIISSSSYWVSNGWPSLPIYCYEGGIDFGNYSGNSSLASALTAMITDSRITAVQLSYLNGLKSAGVNFVNQLNICGNQWGCYQDVMQLANMPPYTDAPRAVGMMEFAQ